MLSSVLYVSTSTYPRGHASDIGILTSAVKNNTRWSLTGCLLRAPNWFAQSLEGPQHALADIFRNIQNDPRHRDMEFWWSETETRRRFPEWRMMMFSIDDHPERLRAILSDNDRSVAERHDQLRGLVVRRAIKSARQTWTPERTPQTG